MVNRLGAIISMLACYTFFIQSEASIISYLSLYLATAFMLRLVDIEFDCYLNSKYKTPMNRVYALLMLTKIYIDFSFNRNVKLNEKAKRF